MNSNEELKVSSEEDILKYMTNNKDKHILVIFGISVGLFGWFKVNY